MALVNPVPPAERRSHRQSGRHYPAFAWTVLLLTLGSTAVALTAGDRAATSAPSADYSLSGRPHMAAVPAPPVAGLGSAPAAESGSGSGSGAESGSVSGVLAAAAPGAASGPLVGPGGLCMDASVRFRRCSGAQTQTWTVVADGTLRTAGRCLDASLRLGACSGAVAQQWDAVRGALVTRSSKQCLTEWGGRPYITRCNGTRQQRWQLPAATAR
ncbi:ricin-type beta-trefoil lectin domain protein [Dactylosporangium sp. NPDC000521]|uniref:ricin-type beta-trefoil lectin domain protein n=1 Tax=Dactylosporangium sp. NPDC000521 TaxID=3363975 RepID=UPI003698696B